MESTVTTDTHTETRRNRLDWKKYLTQSIFTIAITVGASAFMNNVVLGKYIQKIEDTERRVVTLEQFQMRLRDGLEQSRVDQAKIDAQLSSIQKGIEDLKFTQVELMKALGRKQDRRN
jgi:hypothetical protein